MLAYFRWFATVVGTIITAMGLVAVTFARDTLDVAWTTVMNYTAVDYLAAGFAFSLFTQVWYIWQMAKRDLPPRWNPAKKQAFRNLVPLIVDQFNRGRIRTGMGGILEHEAQFLEKLAHLRTRLMLLGFDNYPDCLPGDRDWFLWVGFLESLLPLARKGDIDAAIKLRSAEEPEEESTTVRQQ